MQVHRHEILADRPLIGVGSKISFLFAEYDSRVFYWEVIETLKKLVLTGFMALLPFEMSLGRCCVFSSRSSSHSSCL